MMMSRLIPACVVLTLTEAAPARAETIGDRIDAVVAAVSDEWRRFLTCTRDDPAAHAGAVTRLDRAVRIARSVLGEVGVAAEIRQRFFDALQPDALMLPEDAPAEEIAALCAGDWQDRLGGGRYTNIVAEVERAVTE